MTERQLKIVLIALIAVCAGLTVLNFALFAVVVRLSHARHNFRSPRNESSWPRLPAQPSPGFLFHDTP